MSKNMLIDAAHAEEVRVCVLENGKVEDFDFESSSRKPLRGNIYLARVTRVEPSLQAAFVEYGGNRHGFLAFNEIHPDYYQIPVSDRRILQEAEAEEAALAAELELEQRGDDDDDHLDPEDDHPHDDDDEADFRDSESVSHEDDHGDEKEAAEDVAADENNGDANAADDAAEDGDAASDDDAVANSDSGDSADTAANSDASEETADGDQPPAETEEATNSGAKRGGNRGELLERYREARRKRARLVRNYKIQEVVKRRQILLVQVVKEERGNKGAALTTYMSLAGRYCVLMPNTARGGGISRKIPVAADRKRLRRVVDSLDVPQGMGLIIRTAGAKRTKAEIKRDYDYLIRLWENVRALTLKSIAPCLIYEEASLIKRAIRDLYDKDINLVTVEGDAGYREAKDFMKMLMPSHAKNVQPYKNKTPLFLKHNVESQLDAMYQPTVRLKSGGYLVIHQTEALIAIDVNSGKSTRERNIELTALKTNIEAAKEAARQCRLRDLAGLVVIDFIDMEENKNNRAVEKKLKEALKNDRARLQVGRISNFGLLEMSRQRRRSGIIDGTTHACPTCAGAGVVRSHEMASLRILRAIEGEAIAARAAVVAVRASLEVTLYILNHKRAWLKRIEDDYALTIEIVADAGKAGDQYDVEKRGAPRELTEAAVVRADQPEVALDAPPEAPEVIEESDNDTDTDDAESLSDASQDGESGGRRRRRRRRKRRDDAGPSDSVEAPEKAASDDGANAPAAEARDADDADSDDSGAPKKRRRRGRRGGRRNNRRTENPDEQTADQSGEQPPYVAADDAAEKTPPTKMAVLDDAPNVPSSPQQAPESSPPAASRQVDEPEAEPGPVNGRREPRPAHEGAIEQEEAPAMAESAPEPPKDKEKSSRRGWWQRAIGG